MLPIARPSTLARASPTGASAGAAEDSTRRLPVANPEDLAHFASASSWPEAGQARFNP